LFTILLLQPVFFLRSRPTRGKCERGDGGDVRGPLQELTLGRLALVGVPTDGGDHGHHDGGDHHRWPRLATPAHVLRAAAADVALLLCRKDNCCCNFKCFAAAGPALGGSSQAPPPSSCDLLRPGLL